MYLLLNTSLSGELSFGPIYIGWDEASLKLRETLRERLLSCESIPQPDAAFRLCECGSEELLQCATKWNTIADEDREVIATWFDDAFEQEQREIAC